MNVIQEINRINQTELQNGTVNTPASWHAKYSNSAWVYIGNLSHQLSEGDIISFMSQFGEVEDIHLVREESSGKSKGFCFLKYEDCRSCILAVDNFNGSMVLSRSMRVDHVENYRLPKHLQEKEEKEGVNNSIASTSGTLEAGHAYKDKELLNSYNINKGQDLFAPLQSDDNHRHHDDLIVPDKTREQHRAEKQARKRERDIKRKEKEARREEREERRRLKRARKLKKEDGSHHKKQSKKAKSEMKNSSSSRRRRFDSDDDSDHDEGSYSSSHNSVGS